MKLLWVYDRVDGFVIALQNNILDTLKKMRVEFDVCHISGVKEAYDKFQPITMIFFHPFKLTDEQLNMIHDMHCHKILWSMEEPYEIDLTRKYGNYIYYAISQDKNSAIYLTNFFNESVFMPHAANPKIHKKIDVPHEYKSDLFFCGNAFPERIKFLESVSDFLKDYSVTIIGVGYNGMKGYENQNILNYHISTQEMVKYINGAKVNLNLHRLHGLDMANKENIEYSSPNNRLFEIASCGGCQLVDSSRGEEIKEYYPEGVTTFKDATDFKSKFSKLISSSTLRKKLGNKARKITLQKHTYEKRLSDCLLKILWKKPEEYK